MISEKIRRVNLQGILFLRLTGLTGEFSTIVVFEAMLFYSQCIYAERMLSAKEPQWINANNHALHFLEGARAIGVCDNCK